MSRPDVIKQLTDLRIDEVSLVDRGANQHAKVLISKRADDVEKASPTPSGLHHQRPLGDDEKKRKKKRLSNDEDEMVTVADEEDELSKADDSDEELLALLERLAQRRHKTTLTEEPEEEEPGLAEGLGLEEEGEEEEPEGEEDPLASLLGGAADEEGTEGEEPEEDEEEFSSDELPPNDPGALGEVLPEAAAENEPKAMPGDLPEEVADYVSELERTVDELERKFKEEGKAEVGKSADAGDASQEDETVAKNGDDLTAEELSFLEELSKSLDDDEVDPREVVSKAVEEVRKLQERVEKSEGVAKAERELRLTREAIEKARNDFPHLPVDPNEFGPVLKRIQETLDEDEYAVLSKALAGSDKLSEMGGTAFTEVGKRGTASSANNEVDALADEMVTKGDAKSREEAIAKLYAERPELYDEYLSENEAQVR